MMKAMVLHELGGPVRLQEVPVPSIGPDDALVRVRATGVGLTVVIMTANPGLVTRFPRIPGHEVAGEVVAVGSQVQTVKQGDRVACHFYFTCKACRYCRSGRETLCVNFKGYLGMAADGGYAEYLSVPALNLCPIPDGVSDLEAAVASLVERCFYALRSPPRRVAGADVVYPPQLLEDAYLPDAARIAAALRTAMDE